MNPQIGMAVYRRFVYQSLHTINFDNPVYRKTTSSSSPYATDGVGASGEQLNTLSSVLTSTSTLTHLSSLTSSSHHLASSDPSSDDGGGGGGASSIRRVITASTTLGDEVCLSD